MDFESPSTTKKSDSLEQSSEILHNEREDFNIDRFSLAREVIEGVDLKTLSEIFDELRKKSGSYNRGITSKERIKVLPESVPGISHGTYARYEGINIVADYVEQPTTGTPEEFRNQMLCILIHEQTHSASSDRKYLLTLFSDERTERLRSLLRPVPISQIGYALSEYSLGFRKERFDYFSEGVTDLIAQGVHEEYIKRTGDRKVFFRENEDLRYSEGYKGARVIVTAFVEVIAHATGVPQEEVWQAVVQGYMTGLDLRQTDLQRAFNEIFSSNFQKKIANTTPDSPQDSVEYILEVAKKASLDDTAKQSIMTAYEKFLKLLNEKK